MPIEVKSGIDYKKHSALDKFLGIGDYNIHKAMVVSNERESFTKEKIHYSSIYNIMFLESAAEAEPDALYF